MAHLVLTFVVLVAAGVGMALGVLLKGRPLARGCDRAAGDACARRPGDVGDGGCGASGACGRGRGP
jgi:hypothetical protein